MGLLPLGNAQDRVSNKAGQLQVLIAQPQSNPGGVVTRGVRALGSVSGIEVLQYVFDLATDLAAESKAFSSAVRALI